jgi:predicted anti-sigma-YlaC factor YlaD
VSLFRPFQVLVRLSAVAALVALTGCSLKTTAVKTVANSLSDTGDVFTRDDDPELIRDAVPFALKLYESLLESVPTHGPLLLSTCSSFTQYAFAFVQTEADVIRFADLEEAARLDRRALALYLRGRDYCLRAMEQRFKGIGARLVLDPADALRKAERKDVELLYWSAASWGSAIALAPDRPDLLIDFPIVRALIDRAAALDASWSKGAVHEMLITLESLETLGGSRAKAREHFEQAIKLQEGASPGPYVALAAGVSVAAQDRAEFEKLLDQALAIDPEKDPSTRLTTLVVQRRARALRDQADSLFSK